MQRSDLTVRMNTGQATNAHRITPVSRIAEGWLESSTKETNRKSHVCFGSIRCQHRYGVPGGVTESHLSRTQQQ